MLNSIVIMGRLTAPPEFRQTQNGTAVCPFTLAVERSYGEKDNRQTDFLDVVAWKQTAEFVAKYFTKGQLVAVKGRLETRGYEDKNGNKRKAFEVIAENVYFAEKKREDDTTSYTPSVRNDFSEVATPDDDLPF